MKKIISLVLAFVMITGLCIVSAGAEEEKTLKLGDYITLGKYNGEDIVWRYVLNNDNGKMMLSDSILCEKSYLKEGANGYEEQDWYYSSLRFWLNCDNKSSIWKSAYKKTNLIDWDEDGFLKADNFTDTEKSAMKSVKNSVTVSRGHTAYYPVRNTEYAKGVYPYGKQLSKAYFDYEFIGNTLDEYNMLKRESPVDTVFLLEVKEVLEINKNFPGYIQAVGDYWLRTPETDNLTDNHFLKICECGNNATKTEKERGFEFCKGMIGEESGIRPAFYLNDSTVVIISGDGTRENPYVIDGECEDGLQIGDYITFGKYKDEPLLWRYVADDENGKLFLSARNIDTMVFSVEGDRFWDESDMRSFLREVFFSTENFDEFDKSAVKTVDIWRVTYYWSGETGYVYSHNYSIENTAEEYIESMRCKKGKDNIFLLNYSQLVDIYKNYEVLGDYLIKVDDSNEKVTGVNSYSGEEYPVFTWWTRDLSDYVRGGQGGTTYGGDRIVTVSPTGYYGPWTTEAHVSGKGAVRPAFYLNENNSYIQGGKGTKSDPYVVLGKRVETFEKDGLYGYKDTFGNIVCEAKFLKAGEFYDGVALVVLPEDPYRLRFIDMDGNYLFDKAFYAVNNFNSGYALCVANEKGEYTYIDKTGNFATDLRFESAQNFNNYVAEVVLDGQKGWVDKNFVFYTGEMSDEYSLVRARDGFRLKFGDFFEEVYKNQPEVVKLRDNVYQINSTHIDLTLKNEGYSNYKTEYIQFVDTERKRASDVYNKSTIYYSDDKYVVYYDYKELALVVADLIDKEDCYLIKRNFYWNYGDYAWDISIKDDEITFSYYKSDGWWNSSECETVKLSEDLRK